MTSRRIRRIAWFVCALSFTLAVSCSKEPDEEPVQERPVQAIEVSTSFSFVTSTSRVRFDIPHDARFASQSAVVRFSGRLLEGGDFSGEYVAIARRDEDAARTYLELDVSSGLWSDISPSPVAIFQGDITIEVLDLLGPLARGAIENTTIEFVADPEPVASALERSATIYPGQHLTLTGRHFLRPEEGTVYAIVERGSVAVDGEAEPRDVKGRRVPLIWNDSRTEAILPVLPQVFGIHPGRFEATFRFESELRGSSVALRGENKITFSSQMAEPRISRVTPLNGSRSQIVSIEGRGFLENNSESGYGMYLRYEGGFTPDADPERTIDYRAQRAIERPPLRVVSEALIEQDIWYTVDQETFTLSGLGAMPGKFEGRVVPVLLYGAEQEVGQGFPMTFRVLPTKQIVYLRFLPSFSESLERFGLTNVESDIRALIFEVLRRDYNGINIQFVDAPPENFQDFMTIEVGGPDPTGQNLLGYDNSFNGVPKDTGNLFLRDYLGGYNRQSQDANYSPYGGIFIESFIVFSPKLAENSPETTVIFDSIMGAVMPELGGTPVMATEWPEGPRVDEIRGAISLIGRLAGHTASHEVGHSLGLPFVAGEDPEDVVYHNEALDEAFIMDAGTDRPFQERAELGGQGPAKFSPRNRAYLERILPLE